MVINLEGNQPVLMLRSLQYEAFELLVLLLSYFSKFVALMSNQDI